MIVDDEPLARKNIQALLQQRDDIEIVLNTGDPETALAMLLRATPHILFLDIKMPGLSGIDLLRRLTEASKPLPYVIFVTAYDEYAVEAFELQALDYLVKPFSDRRFAAALEKAMAQASLGEQAVLLQQMLLQGMLPANQAILLEVDRDMIKVLPQDIHWLEAADHYLIVHMAESQHIVRKTMTEMLADLPEGWFVQTHRSACVNLKRVQALKRNLVGNVELKLENGASVKVSRRRVAEVKQAMLQLSEI